MSQRKGEIDKCGWRWSDEADVSTQVTNCEHEFICYPTATNCPGCGKPLEMVEGEQEDAVGLSADEQELWDEQEDGEQGDV